MSASLALPLFAAWCALASLVDLRTHRLPDRLTAAGALAVLGYAAGTGQFLPALLGAVLLAGVYLAAHLVAPAGIGAGDVKLAVALGAAAACAGARAWVWAALLAPLGTAVAGLVLLALRHRRGLPVRGQPVPHGPAMCAATLFAVATPMAVGQGGPS
ncbi:prepilin peptidase [Nocardia sp. NPDC057227]|uniref:prepilin peptidase n=1 Tax=Nocardia sp. NPDC057227 TaxID=3346056 RepID=UPI00362A779E